MRFSKTTYDGNQSAKDRVWRYIRRNKMFSFVDIKIVCGVSDGTLKSILWHLVKSGYLNIKGDEKSLKKRVYLHARKRKFGLKSPSLVNGVVYDHNTKQEYKIEVQRKEPTKPFFPTVLYKMLKAMRESTMTKEEIVEISGVARSAKRHWEKLQKHNIMCEIENKKRTKKSDPLFERKDGKKLYRIDLVLVNDVIDFIDSGKYNQNVNRDLSVVWKQEQ